MSILTKLTYINMQSVLQDWVMELPLREQGTLLTCTRGCDLEAKIWESTGVAYSPGRRLTGFIRCCFMVPADPREVDSQEGAFMMSTPPIPFKPSEFGIYLYIGTPMLCMHLK